MTFNWDDYLILARRLAAKSGGIECIDRTAVSRVYYSLFHQCSAYAITKGRPIPTAAEKHSEHSSLPQWFRRRFDDADLQEVGAILMRMRRARVQCDYEQTILRLDKLLQLTFRDAEEIKRLLKI